MMQAGQGASLQMSMLESAADPQALAEIHSKVEALQMKRGTSFNTNTDTVASWISAKEGRKHAKTGARLEQMELEDNGPQGDGVLEGLGLAEVTEADEDEDGDGDDGHSSSGESEIEVLGTEGGGFADAHHARRGIHLAAMGNSGLYSSAQIGAGTSMSADSDTGVHNESNAGDEVSGDNKAVGNDSGRGDEDGQGTTGANGAEMRSLRGRPFFESQSGLGLGSKSGRGGRTTTDQDSSSNWSEGGNWQMEPGTEGSMGFDQQASSAIEAPS